MRGVRLQFRRPTMLHTFKLLGSFRQVLGHVQQYFAVSFRFGLVGRAQTFLRELAKVYGGCWHVALRTGGGGTGLSAPGALACRWPWLGNPFSFPKTPPFGCPVSSRSESSR